MLVPVVPVLAQLCGCTNDSVLAGVVPELSYFRGFADGSRLFLQRLRLFLQGANGRSAHSPQEGLAP